MCRGNTASRAPNERPGTRPVQCTGRLVYTLGMEQAPSPEQHDLKTRVIEVLRQKGPEDPETQELFKKWMDIEIAKVESIPDTDRANYVRAQIMLNIDRAGLYLQGGQQEAALADLEDARTQAEQEGCGDLVAAIDIVLRALFGET